MELSGSDHTLSQGTSRDGGAERTKMEQADSVDVTVLRGQVPASFVRLEVTSPRKTKNGSRNRKKKSYWKLFPIGHCMTM